ncbi:hypothetical protein NA8A_18267 [Nitratireductor indicus C115]|uniref:Uncharacterized protein n=1 Tax=Nitratireductor indicus C115 TaxID=1231190 RepID=K2N015_9HYPH|nr:hypothetical protein [Nitratireductor indicus]EKF40863.1 hypothetical protein NA8A_18267 [Nitratireductor indicus C115]SFQ33548.1 hypothetical protein SAMN05216176_102640 [Nitratireductor indicus]
MNAYSRTAVELAAAIGFDPENIVVVRRRLADAIDLYDNEDGLSRDIAVEAIIGKRPAFWTTAKYHSAIACELVNDANRTSLEEAMENIPAHRRADMARYLDTLVPLNRLAANELSEAYETVAGTFRDCSELESRRIRRAA